MHLLIDGMPAGAWVMQHFNFLLEPFCAYVPLAFFGGFLMGVSFSMFSLSREKPICHYVANPLPKITDADLKKTQANYMKIMKKNTENKNATHER